MGSKFEGDPKERHPFPHSRSKVRWMGCINGRVRWYGQRKLLRAMISSFIWPINYGCIKGSEWDARKGISAWERGKDDGLFHVKPQCIFSIMYNVYLSCAWTPRRLSCIPPALRCINHENVLEGASLSIRFILSTFRLPFMCPKARVRWSNHSAHIPHFSTTLWIVWW